MARIRLKNGRTLRVPVNIARELVAVGLAEIVAELAQPEPVHVRTDDNHRC
jgi:hypothetical protein